MSCFTFLGLIFSQDGKTLHDTTLKVYKRKVHPGDVREHQFGTPRSIPAEGLFWASLIGLNVFSKIRYPNCFILKTIVSVFNLKLKEQL